MLKRLKTSAGKRQDCLCLRVVSVVCFCGVCRCGCGCGVCVVVAVVVVCVCVCGVVWHVQNAPRLYIQNVPVCTGTTRTCVSTCARDAGTHGDVLNVHTGAFWMDSQRFFSAPHHSRHTAHIPHTKHNTNATSHGDGQRESEKEDRERGERRDDERREEGGRERKEKKNSVLTCTRVACTCRRHSFCSFYFEKRS